MQQIATKWTQKAEVTTAAMPSSEAHPGMLSPMRALGFDLDAIQSG
jgi:hypothetical protein